ncbi:MAG: SGNH/GDSL hydrolase family protein [Acidimicrobiales bacterium]
MSLLSAAVLLIAVLAVSCSTSGTSAGEEAVAPSAGTAPPPPPAKGGETRVVVVGASDAVGYGADDPAGDAWPAVLERMVLPDGATIVNLGIPGATVATALEQEVPAALAAEPDVVLVWLSVNDLLAQVPAATFERQLGDLVRALRRNGAARVLVGNTPPLDRLPIFLACQADPGCLGGALPGPAVVEAAVETYNASIDRVAAVEGADVVDLHALAGAARRTGTDSSLVGADGFHPSTAGHRAIAGAFAETLRRH